MNVNKYGTIHQNKIESIILYIMTLIKLHIYQARHTMWHAVIQYYIYLDCCKGRDICLHVAMLAVVWQLSSIPVSHSTLLLFAAIQQRDWAGVVDTCWENYDRNIHRLWARLLQNYELFCEGERKHMPRSSKFVYCPLWLILCLLYHHIFG